MPTVSDIDFRFGLRVSTLVAEYASQTSECSICMNTNFPLQAPSLFHTPTSTKKINPENTTTYAFPPGLTCHGPDSLAIAPTYEPILGAAKE